MGKKQRRKQQQIAREIANSAAKILQSLRPQPNQDTPTSYVLDSLPDVTTVSYVAMRTLLDAEETFVQVATRCGYVVYFMVPSLGKADTYVRLCSCGDIIPSPADFAATQAFWQSKGAMNIAVSKRESMYAPLFRRCLAIRRAELNAYERSKSREQRLNNTETPAAEPVAAAEPAPVVEAERSGAYPMVTITHALRTYGYASIGQAVLLKITTSSNHVIHMTYPYMSDPHEQLFPYAPGAMVPHPDDRASTLEYWTSRGALDIAVGICTSMDDAEVRRSLNILGTALLTTQQATQVVNRDVPAEVAITKAYADQNATINTEVT